MRKRWQRLGAQDLFEQSTRPFAKRGHFSEIFPEVERFLVEFEEVGIVERADRHEGFTPVHCGKMTQHAVSQYIRCTNYRCYGGGIEIVQIVGEMVRNRETERTGEAECIGHEGTPKGRKIYGKCFNRFRYCVKISYKVSSPEEQTESHRAAQYTQD